jgi:hypothetical protein
MSIPRYWLVLRADGTPDAYLLATSIESAQQKIPDGFTVRPLRANDDTSGLMKVSPRSYRSVNGLNLLAKKNICVSVTPENFAWFQAQVSKSESINKLIENHRSAT